MMVVIGMSFYDDHSMMVIVENLLMVILLLDLKNMLMVIDGLIFI